MSLYSSLYIQSRSFPLRAPLCWETPTKHALDPIAVSCLAGQVTGITLSSLHQDPAYILINKSKIISSSKIVSVAMLKEFREGVE